MAGLQVSSGAVVLSARKLAKRFGGVVALDGVDLDLPRGTIVGLAGPNGAGKTTLFDVLSGFSVPDKGTLHLGGHSVTGWPPERLAWTRPGLVRSFQEVRVFEQLSVLDNVLVARPFRAGSTLFGVWRRWAIAEEREQEMVNARSALKAVGLKDLESRQANELSYGQRKLLELARCLVGNQEVILLDEPFAGINPSLIAVTSKAVRRAREIAGKTFFVVDHNHEALARLCDQVWNMVEGRLEARLASESHASEG